MSGGVPVFVMLPLDTVNADGVFAYASTPWFTGALNLLSSSGVKGVAIDCWWGAVEKKPKQYDFSAYRHVCNLVKRYNLRLQIVMSFHACGSNVNDTVSIPLPEWVLEAGKKEPDIFFMDRPRDGSMGRRNRECVSFFADDVKCLDGRTPLECYHDMMAAFAVAMHDMIGNVIEEVVVGTGPCGELRYPSYVERNGWKFPGVGEFQCYDRRALASLAKAAQEAGHPEWGLQGPSGVGQYNNLPQDTHFFTWNGGWQTPQGDFFLRWYSAALLLHGQRVLEAAVRVFFPYMYASTQRRIRERGVVRTSDLATSPPSCQCVESDATAWPSDLSSVPSEVNAAAAARGSEPGADGPPGPAPQAFTPPIRASSPNPTQVSSVHSQRSLSGGLCDLGRTDLPGAVENSSNAGPSLRDHDIGEGRALTWDGAFDAHARLSIDASRQDWVPNHAAAAAAAAPRTWATPEGGCAATAGGGGGGLHNAHGSMRNMLWKSPRGGEMPALPESEPLRSPFATRHTQRAGFPRGSVKSDPTLGGAARGGGDGGRSGVGGAQLPGESPREAATLASGLGQGARGADARLCSEDGREGAPGMVGGGGGGMDATGLSMPTSRSSSFMSVASAVDGRREANCLLMSVKLAGVHWWYHSPSHAAELTAGYYNCNGHDGYEDIIRMCADYGAGVILTCVEMSDAQHPPEALCGPEALLRQVRESAHLAGLMIAGENALPCISKHGVNTHALEHIVKNTRAHYVIPRRGSGTAPRPRHTPLHAPLPTLPSATTWKPATHKACSSTGHVPEAASVPHVYAGNVLTQVSHAGSASTSMRKAISWVDLKRHNTPSTSSFWSHDANVVRAPPRNGAADGSGWPGDESHVTLPYSMGGSREDLRDLGPGSGGNSAPITPMRMSPGSRVDSGGGGGQVLTIRQSAAAVLPQPLQLSGGREAAGAGGDATPGGAAGAGEADADAAPGTVLQPMRMFTFLRMCPEMLHPGHSGQWLHFMRRMHQRG